MKTQVAIVGGGPGGATTALYLHQQGIQSIVVEKEPFPRFHIGESMTGECGGIVRELGFEVDMQGRSYPIKKGVMVYGPEARSVFWVPVMRRDDDGKLVDTTTWQVRRSDFDQMLLDGVARRGLHVIQGQAQKTLVNKDGSVGGLVVRTNDRQTLEIESDVVVDASGPSTFLHRAGLTGNKERGKYDNQVAIFSHVIGAVRDEVDNTLIFYRAKHHWGWFIPIDPEVVSVGVVVPADFFAEQKESKLDYYLRELNELNPNLSERMQNITLVENVRAISNYSYHIQNFTGKGFLCVGDSHRFVDPIFSFGLYLAVTEAKLATKHIVRYLQGETAAADNPFAEYEALSEKGQDVIQDLVDCFWEYPLAFTFFMHSRYKEDIIDIFAGRIYGDEVSPGLRALRRRLGTSVPA